MNVSMILAAGIGQRMRNAGLPKQFLKIAGKPVIIYTLEKFESIAEVDVNIIVCREGYNDYMEQLLQEYKITKKTLVIIGGDNRQQSIKKGLHKLKEMHAQPNDVVIIHDGVRPLVSPSIIRENIRIAELYGSAMTVRQVNESVVVTASNKAKIADFAPRKNTYSLTSPQSFQIGLLWKAYELLQTQGNDDLPLLDAAMMYARMGNEVNLVKEQKGNIKITTPEDVYYLKAMLELEESRSIFGI